MAEWQVTFRGCSKQPHDFRAWTVFADDYEEALREAQRQHMRGGGDGRIDIDVRLLAPMCEVCGLRHRGKT